MQEAKGKWPALIAAHPGTRAASDRPAAVQQGEGSRCPVRCHPFGGPPEHLRGVGQGDRQSEPAAASVRARSTPARSRKRPASLPTDADDFIAAMSRHLWPHDLRLDVHSADRRAPAPHFALTAKIAKRNGLTQLSMGMSADFAIAIAFGATHVRIGSAIFGRDRALHALWNQNCTALCILVCLFFSRKHRLHVVRKRIRRCNFFAPNSEILNLQLHPIMIFVRGPIRRNSRSIAAASSPRIRRSGQSCRAPGAGTRRCRALRYGGGCCDRSQ